ncbi:virulence factor [Carnobacterium iners]|uniref:Virulence factor n=1 Tax=Carnobacterium iners TaxID=1073423 RepID=A0A1X7N2T8_9LACT|nr:Gfo/Idh/MocA family oxidoreductase [Carnobacterium iners]SEL29265.1 virulence factor [Carnobacterium iners]SMH31596.1 virulence factor [Carnobacterium iners]
MLKIGIIGLGSIARKAYLPVDMEMQDKVEWHLYTRNQNKLQAIGTQYNNTNLHSSIESLIESGIEAAFVHTATHTHAKIVKQLIENGIHVYVDKPISEDLEEVEELIQLAKQKQVLLTVGFNRRFAPMIQKLKDIPDKNMIFIQKTKPNSTGTVKFAIYDMFIHVLDTALFLLDSPIIDISFSVNEKDGELKNSVVNLTTEKTVCIASMNYVSGANYESAEVHSPTGMHRVINLTDYSSDINGIQTTQMFGDWEPTLEKRGFAPLIRLFLAAVESGINPVSTQTTLLSHQLCDKIVKIKK